VFQVVFQFVFQLASEFVFQFVFQFAFQFVFQFVFQFGFLFMFPFSLFIGIVAQLSINMKSYHAFLHTAFTHRPTKDIDTYTGYTYA